MKILTEEAIEKKIKTPMNLYMEDLLFRATDRN